MRDRVFILPVACAVALCAALSVRPAAQSAGVPGERQPVRLRQPRVAPLPESQWTAVHTALVKKYPNPDNGFRTLLNVPAALDGLMPMTVYITDASTLSPRHRELLILRTAWLFASPVVWPAHAARARALGMTDQDLRRIAQGPDAPGWEDRFEQTLLRMADQLYRNSSVNDATWKELAARYSPVNLIDAVETVNHIAFLALIYNSLGVQPDRAADRLPVDIPYRVTVPPREPALTTARLDPVPGTGLAVTRTFERNPKLNEARSPRANFVNRVSTLSPRHREMLILRIGWDCQSEYEWAQHVGRVGRAREHGLDPAQIAAGPQAPAWDPFEATLLRAVDELYRDAVISDATWSALAARFDTTALLSALFTASSYRATSMALNAFGVQLDAGDERFPRVP